MPADPVIPLHTIYVRLLGEGTGVHRPVDAVRLGDNLSIIANTLSPAALDEVWEFVPGDIVVTEVKRFQDGEALAAVRRLPL